MFRTPKNRPQMYGWSNLISILPIYLLECPVRGHCASILPETTLACSYPHLRGGLAIAEAREISISSCASAVGEMDGSMLDFYRTISLYGGTFLLPVNMYLSNLGPICFQETRIEIDVSSVWVCWCTVLDPDWVAEFRRRAYDSQWTLLSFVTKKLNFLMSVSWLAQEENPVLVNGPTAWRAWYYRASSYGFTVWP